MNYDKFKIAIGVLCTIGLYTVLYRENKFYRFFEHMFLGLAAGWMTVVLWTDTLKPSWWDQMVGRVAEEGTEPVVGFWVWALILPIGLMGYFVFSKKHGWIARIPIGIIIGLWSGQQFDAWLQRYMPQIQVSAQPLWPTTTESFTRPATIGLSQDQMTQLGLTPERLAEINANVYPSQAIVNLIALMTVLSVLSYFIFSIDFKSKLMQGSTKMGRYLLMIGFGAIFGSTVMMRFSLLIDRMYFVWIEFFQGVILGR